MFPLGHVWRKTKGHPQRFCFKDADSGIFILDWNVTKLFLSILNTVFYLLFTVFGCTVKQVKLTVIIGMY